MKGIDMNVQRINFGGYLMTGPNKYVNTKHITTISKENGELKLTCSNGETEVPAYGSWRSPLSIVDVLNRNSDNNNTISLDDLTVV